MATIFAKQPASGNNCLILDSREVFFQQLNPTGWLGGGWTDLRIGLFYSFTSRSQLNGQYSAESLSYTNPDNGIIIGLTNTGVYSPSQFTESFIGITSSPISGSGITSLLSTALHGAQGRLYPIASSGFGSTSSGSLSALYPTSPSAATGNSSFAAYCGIRIQVTGFNTTGQSVKVQLDNGVSGAGTNDTSVALLRNRLGNFQAQSESNYMYFTTGFVSNGGPLPLPTGGFMAYVPFLNNRLRIHTLLIERFQPLT